MRDTQRRPAALWVLLACTLFLALSGLAGGAAFLIDPSGALVGAPLALLDGLPAALRVEDYTLPGLFILLVLGVFAAAVHCALAAAAPADGSAAGAQPAVRRGASVAARLRERPVWVATLALGLILLAWMAFEFSVTGYRDPSQIAYTLVGAAMVILLWLPCVRDYFRTG